MPTLKTPDAAFPMPTAAALRKLGDFFLRKVGGRYLISNDWGYYALLEPAQFKDFVAGRIPQDGPLWLELKSKGFLKGHQDFADLTAKFKGHNSFLWKGPSLHIVVLTLRCNLKCVYCHSGVVGVDQTQFDMTLETARKTVDFILSSPNNNVALEFQGGEPLLNWPALRFIVEYVKEHAAKAGKTVALSLVSNFSLLDDEKLDYLLLHNVSLCTSVDGPKEVHDRNRIYLGGNSHESVTRWTKAIRARGRSSGALMTATRFSLSHPREIVDEYRRLEQTEIFLRPLHYLGFAKRSWETIGYDDAAFIAFYRESMDYILELNRGGATFRETASVILLRKILKHEDPGYVDLRSPCGATLGQVSYNYNGDIYTCDEGRMVAAEGDQLFKIGNILKDSFNDIVDHPTTKACCVASSTEGQPLCQTCTYKPYCGICPVLNYATQNTIWGQMPTNSYCYLFMHMFDYLFERLAEPENKRILESWVGMKDASPSQNCVGKI